MHIPRDKPTQIDVCEGEQIWKASESGIGVGWTSVLMTQTDQRCGPPMHPHQNDELHLLDCCEVDYDIGGEQSDLSGPELVQIPANVPHCFVIAADEPFRLVAVFSTDSYLHFRTSWSQLDSK